MHGQRRSKMDNRSDENKNFMNKKSATKHCRWGLCNMDSRYPDRMKQEVFFIKFDKPGHLKETMSGQRIQQNLKRTEKGKRSLHICGKKDFNNIEQIKKETYGSSLHFLIKKDLLENTLIP